MDDKQDVAGLVERMKRQAGSASEVSRWLAEDKSLRQEGNHEGRKDLYTWEKPEQTLEWKAATALEALSAENARLREAFAGTIIVETVENGNWSMTVYFGQGQNACQRMQSAADLARALTGSQSHD